MTFAPINSMNAFLQHTENFPEDNEKFLVKLNATYSDIAQSVNVREIALYNEQEILTGQQFSVPGNPQKKRYSFRKIFYFGAIATGATLLIPHGLNIADITMFTRIYGTAVTDVVDYVPLPCVDVFAVNAQVSINILGPNIVIASGAVFPDITSGMIVLEYLRN